MKSTNRNMPDRASFQGRSLVRIDPVHFVPDMDIGTEVYLWTKGNFALFCKNVYADQVLYSRLKRILNAGDCGVYILEEHVEEFMKKSRECKGQSDNEAKTEAAFDVESHREEEMQSIKLIGEKARNLIRAFEGQGEFSEKELDNVAYGISEKIFSTESSIILQCINEIRSVDDGLYIHSRNVAILNGIMGSILGKDKNEIDTLVKIGLLHDVGKLKIPREILDKPGKLTDEEFTVIKLHPAFSEEMLKNVGVKDKKILTAVRGHHERPEGGGYPDGLSGKNLSEYARITAVSDVYDAMVSKRAYKDANSPFDILADMAENAFSNLDESMVNAFIKAIPPQYVGKQCTMTDGREGIVMFVNSQNVRFPVVKIDNKLVKTTRFEKCARVDCFISD